MTSSPVTTLTRSGRSSASRRACRASSSAPDSAAGSDGSLMPTVSRAWPSAGSSRASAVRSTSANAGSAVRQQRDRATVAGRADHGDAQLRGRVVEHRAGHLAQVRPAGELGDHDRQRRVAADAPACRSRTWVSGWPPAPRSTSPTASSAICRLTRSPSSRRARSSAAMTASWPMASATSELPGRPDPLDHDHPRGHPLAERRPHGKDRVRRARRRAAATAGSRSAVRKARVTRSRSSGRQRARAADDRTAGRREDAAGQAGLGADEGDQLVQAAALGDGLEQLALPVQGGGQPRAAPGGDARDDELGEGGEGDVLGHRQQRQVVPAAGLDHVRRHAVEHRLAGGEGHRARRGAGRDEALAVVGAAPPHQPGDDQLAAGQVAARVGQVGGVDPAHRPVERPGVAVVQAQVELRRIEQLPHPHWRNVQLGSAQRSGLSFRRPLGRGPGGWT